MYFVISIFSFGLKVRCGVLDFVSSDIAINTHKLANGALTHGAINSAYSPEYSNILERPALLRHHLFTFARLDKAEGGSGRDQSTMGQENASFGQRAEQSGLGDAARNDESELHD